MRKDKVATKQSNDRAVEKLVKRFEKDLEKLGKRANVSVVDLHFRGFNC